MGTSRPGVKRPWFGHHRLLTRDEEFALGRRIQAGGPDAAEARHALCLSNMRLVISTATKFQGRGLEMEDLIQVGFIGLDRAARKFDPERGNRFSTMAVPWVTQAIQRGCAFAGSNTIRLPDVVNHVRLTILNNPELSDDEIARRHKVPVDYVGRAKTAAQVTTSLDRPRRRDDPDRHELIADPATVDSDGEASDRADDLLACLPAAERRVVELAFGLNGHDGHEHTDAEIASLLDIPKSEAQNIRLVALRRMRASAKS